MLEVSPVRAFSDARPVSEAQERRVSAVAMPAHPIGHGIRRIDAVRELRQRDQASLPTTIAPERELDESVYCREPAACEATAAGSGRSRNSRVEMFMTAPSWKDGLR